MEYKYTSHAIRDGDSSMDAGNLDSLLVCICLDLQKAGGSGDNPLPISKKPSIERAYWLAYEAVSQARELIKLADHLATEEETRQPPPAERGDIRSVLNLNPTPSEPGE